MNKFFTKIAALSVGLAMAIGVGVAVSSDKKSSVAHASSYSATMSYSGSTGNMAASGNAATVGLDANIFTVDATKQGSNFPGLNTDGTIRLYYGNDGSITVSITDDYVIDDISIEYYSNSYNGAAIYVGGNSVTGTTDFTIDSTSFVIKNGRPSSGQVRIVSVEINYSDAGSSGTSFTVTYNANGGTCAKESEQVAENGHPTFPDASKQYNTFTGWKTAGDNTLYTSANASSYTVTGDVTFTAQYTAATYTVTYDANGATSGTVPVDANSPYNGGASVTVLGNTGNLAKPYCTFDGWNTAADGSGTPYTTGNTFNIDANTTLFAQWEDDNEKLEITRSSFPEGALAYNVTDVWSATATTGDTVAGEGDLYSTANQTTMQTKNSGVSTHYHNTDPVPGFISKITLDYASGTDRTYNVFLSKTPITSTSGLTQVGTVTGATDFVGDPEDEYCYFWLTCTGGASYLNKISIFFVEDKSPSVELSTNSISLKTTQTAGLKVSATVRNVAEPTYQWVANNSNVTLVDDNTSEVTIKPNTDQDANSTVTLTVGGATPALSPVSVSVSISVPGPGETPETAYSASSAAAAIAAASADIEDIYVTGIISQIDQYYSSSHSINYYISDDGSTSGQFKIYGGKGLNGSDFNSIDDISLGDTVILFGTISKTYSNLNAGNYIVSRTEAPKVNSITLSPSIITVEPEDTGSVVSLFTTITINQDEGAGKTVNDIVWTSDDSSVLSISNGSYTVAGAHKPSTTINAKIGDVVYGSATVNVIDPDHPFITYDVPTSYTKVTSTTGWEDGEYLIVYENGESSYAFNGATFTDTSGNSLEVTISEDVLVPNATLDAATVWITSTNDGYTIQNHSKTQYVSGKNSNNNGLKIDTNPLYNSLTFEAESETTVALFKDGSNNVLRYNSSDDWFRFYKASTYTAQKAIQLYKKSGGEVETIDLDTTISNLVNSHMSVYLDEHNVEQYGIAICNYFGGGLDKDEWDDMGADLTESIINTYKLNYARSNRNGNEVEKFLSAYDYVVENYGADYDFLGRIATGKVTPAQGRISFGTKLSNNGNTTAIIVIISLGALATVGGYFFLRKRKEN